MNKKCSMEKKITNSKFKISKNFLYFMIIPIAILLVGVILISSIGFKLGTDFTGSSSVKVYVSHDAYDLNDNEDYDKIYEKVQDVFKSKQFEDLKIVSYRTSSMDMMHTSELNPNAPAIEIVFQNSSTDEDKINDENAELRQALIAEFGYADLESGVSSVDFSPADSSFDWKIGILAAVVFGLVAAIVYMMFRYDKSSWIVLILQVALDILMFISMLSIFRLTVNLTIGIAVLATFVLSIVNAFMYYAKMKENIKSGKFTNMKNSEMADANIKESLFKKLVMYFVMLILVFVLVIAAVEGVREVALALAISLIVTLFTSTFFTPAVWAIVYKEKKKKSL